MTNNIRTEIENMEHTEALKTVIRHQKNCKHAVKKILIKECGLEMFQVKDKMLDKIIVEVIKGYETAKEEVLQLNNKVV